MKHLYLICVLVMLVVIGCSSVNSPQSPSCNTKFELIKFGDNEVTTSYNAYKSAPIKIDSHPDWACSVEKATKTGLFISGGFSCKINEETMTVMAVCLTTANYKRVEQGTHFTTASPDEVTFKASCETICQ